MDKVGMEQLIIRGRIFYLDRELGVLVPNGQPNYIFTTRLWRKGQVLAYARFDVQSGRLLPDCPKTQADPALVKVAIPTEVLMAHEEPDEKRKAMLNEQSIYWDWGVVLVDRAIRKRLSGKLPELRICGAAYTVLLKEGLLVPVPSDRPSLPLSSFIALQGERYLLGVLDRCTLRMVDMDDAPVARGSYEQQWIRIPGKKFLDPVAWAGMNGLDHAALLCNVPLKHKMKARKYTFFTFC